MNIDCTDSEKFYELNRILGLKEETTTNEVTSNELTPGENIKFNSVDRISAIPNKEINQRFKAPMASRIKSQIGPIRNQILKKTTAIPYISTERIPQTTNYRDFIIDRNELSNELSTVNDFVASTTFPPVNIAQFFDLTTRKTFNYPTTTFGDNSEFTTDFAGGSTSNANEFTTNRYDSNTRIVPDLVENEGKNSEQTKADEVIESIKQLQKFYPSSLDDSREKRFLFKADSVKNRQKLFEMLNQ